MLSNLLRRFSRTTIAYCHDVAMAAVGLPLAMYLRLGDDLFAFTTMEQLAANTFLFATIAAVVFWGMGLYRGIGRYASMNDLWAIARAVTVAVIVFVLGAFVLTRL